mgnify:CR=1 FL=1
MRPFRFALVSLVWGCLVGGAGCALPVRQPPQVAVAVARDAGPAERPKEGESAGASELPELRAEFEAERVRGTIALFDTKDGVLRCSDLGGCAQAVVPASTFKIPSSIIALETGVVEGSDTRLPWDGKAHSVPEWNQDMTFRKALQVSCVPCYQAIARKVGEARMREWVTKLGFGNRDISGGVDRFWLGGALRISPLEQIDFLRRFDGDKLPISSRTADIVRDIMTLDVTDSYVLRGKTGYIAPPEVPSELGWFVGWLELGERRVYFATLLTGHEPGVELRPARRQVTERVLRARGYL